MNKEEIKKRQRKFWDENFKKYTTEPNENGFDFNVSEMMEDFALEIVKEVLENNKPKDEK